MKTTFVISVCFLLPFSSFSQNALKIECYINKKMTEHIKTLAKDDTITLKLVGTDQKYLYAFREVKVEIVTTRFSDGGQVLRTQHRGPSVNLNNYMRYNDSFSKNPTLIIPYSLFYDGCLSRVILQIKKINKKRGNDILKVDVDEFDYQNEMSFFAQWQCVQSRSNTSTNQK